MMDRESRPNCPLLGGHKLKLGLFGTNLQLRIYTVSTAPTNYRATWEQTLTIVLDAQGARFRTTRLAMMCVMALGAPALFRSARNAAIQISATFRTSPAKFGWGKARAFIVFSRLLSYKSK